MMRRSGFTFVEVVLFLVIIAVLGASIIPQFRPSYDERSLAPDYHLQTIQSQLNLYKSQHRGRSPEDLALLLRKTDASGRAGIGPEFPLGPYLLEIPTSLLHSNNRVVAGNGSAVVGTGQAWQYDSASGTVWLNHADHLPDSGGYRVEDVASAKRVTGSRKIAHE